MLFQILEIKASLNFSKLFTNSCLKHGMDKHDKLLCDSASFCLSWDKEKYK